MPDSSHSKIDNANKNVQKVRNIDSDLSMRNDLLIRAVTGNERTPAKKEIPIKKDISNDERS